MTCLAALLSLLALALGAAPAIAAPAAPEAGRAPLKVVRVAEETGGGLSGLSSVRYRQSLELSFENTGLISQVLARLDDKVLAAELKAKQAEAEAAEVERLTAKKQEKEKLFQGRAVTASEVREAGFELDKALAKVRATQAETAALAARERNLVLKAPVAGTVLKRLSEPGEVVTPNSQSKVLKLADCRQVLCEVELGERLYTQIRSGQEVTLVADALPSRRFVGKVHAVGVEVDEKNRTFIVKVAVDNPDLALKPGMFVRATVKTGGQESTLWLPPQALRDERGDLAEVTVIQDRKATPRPVRLGRRESGRVQVLEGVSAGDLVVVTGEGEVSADKRP